MKASLPQRVRVGAFEIDLRAGQVRDDERVIVLPEQSLQILRMLIEGAGEIVTREEIQQRLGPTIRSWSSTTLSMLPSTS